MATKDVKLTYNVTVELKEMLDRYCEDNDVSMSDTIRRALKQFLQDINK